MIKTKSHIKLNYKERQELLINQLSVLKKKKKESIYSRYRNFLNNKSKKDKSVYWCYFPKLESEWIFDFCQIIDFAESKKIDWLNHKDFIIGLINIVNFKDYWIRKPKDYKIKSHNIERQFSGLLRHLFCKYDVPLFMDSIWMESDNVVDVNIEENKNKRLWFIDIGNGKNIRKCDNLPLIVTKKMAHYFLKVPKKLSVYGAFRWAQVLSEGGNEQNAIGILGTSIAYCFDNDDFWKSVIRFFINNPMLDTNQYGPIVDYIQNQKFNPQITMIEGKVERKIPQPNFSMHGRSIDSLLNKVEEWHKKLNSQKEIYNNKSWEPCNIKDFLYESNSKTWSISQITTYNRLCAEGKILNHCVRSYHSSCASYNTSIWSMMLSDDQQLFKNKLTIELNIVRKEIIQIRGFSNRKAFPQEIEIIKKWAIEENLKFSPFVLM